MKNLFTAKHLTTIAGIAAQALGVVIGTGLLEGHPIAIVLLFIVGIILEAYGYDVVDLEKLKPTKTDDTDTKK